MAAKVMMLLMILSISTAAKDHSAVRHLREGPIVAVPPILTTISHPQPGERLDSALQKRLGHVVDEVERVDAQAQVWDLEDYAKTTPRLSHQWDKSP